MQVVQVANDPADKEAPRVKLPTKVAKDLTEKGPAAAAVRIRWPEDLDREVPEKENYVWSVLTKDNWNKEVVLGWRYSAAELKKRAAAEAAAKRARR